MKRPPGALTLSEDDRRVLAVWAADCAERTLWLFEAKAPNDTRLVMPSTASEPSPVATWLVLGRQPAPPRWMNGVVVASSTNPSRWRIGRLSGEASTWR
jgi:hypothetical protein